MPKGSSPATPKKSSVTTAFNTTSKEQSSSASELEPLDEHDKISYIRRTITIASDLDQAINQLVTQERKKGKRENRSTIIEAALRDYLAQ